MDDALNLELAAPYRGQGRVDARRSQSLFSWSPRSEAMNAGQVPVREGPLRPGDMGNRIKECQLDLYADRTSTATMRANQVRLWFASMATC
jgi:Transposase DDE domain group 1